MWLDLLEKQFELISIVGLPNFGPNEPSGLIAAGSFGDWTFTFCLLVKEKTKAFASSWSL